MLRVEIKEQVGETAGKIWHLLDETGPQTLAQIKKKFDGSSEVAVFALGWLAREDKVDISQDKKSFKVALR
jgi:hypothetical protein